MGKKLGNDYRLWVESATPGTYNMLKGQQNLSISRQSQTIDTSTKDDFPYASQAPGLRSLSIAVGVIPDLPDANGFTRIESLSLSGSVATPFKVQIRKNGAAGASPADVVFECSMYSTDFPTNFDQNDAVKANFTLVAAAAPVTDALS